MTTDERKRLNEQVIQRIFGYTFAPAEDSLYLSRLCDRWVPPVGRYGAYDAYSAKDQSGWKGTPLPDFAYDLNDCWDVVHKLTESDWRLTLEALRSGESAKERWKAVFYRPHPEPLPNESLDLYWQREAAFNHTAYAEGDTAPEAILSAALKTVEG